MNRRDMAVLLTGAAGGIGSAIAAELAAGGATLLLVGRSEASLAATARALRASTAARVEVLPADITRASDRLQLAQAAAAHGVNVLINAAGTPCFGVFGQQPEDEIASVMLTNLVAPMQLTRALLPQLAARSESRVLNVGSALGRLGLPGYAVYSAAKFGLRGFSEALRRELAGTPVRVQYLGPRATRTAFNDHRVDTYNRAVGSRSDAPEAVARAAVRLLESGAPERFLGFPEALAVRVNGLAPGLLDAALSRHASVLRAVTQLPAA